MIPEFHQYPHNEVSIEVKAPADFISQLIKKYEDINVELKKDSKMFPGDTNFTGHAIDEAVKMIDDVLYFLKVTKNASL